MTEQKLLNLAKIKGWDWISQYQPLPESFMDKHQSFIRWHHVSRYQVLSESFIEKYQYRVDWDRISRYQTLSESFMEKYQDKLFWPVIGKYQTLSESFIDKFKAKLDWIDVSQYQTLSESFIQTFHDKVYWYAISAYQTLSEPFIEKHKLRVNWARIGLYQTLSESFIEEHDITKFDYNWLHKSGDERLRLIKKSELYEVKGNHVYAYKAVDMHNRSIFMPAKYTYEVNKTYHSKCDYTATSDDSCGLYAWVKECAQEYNPDGNLLLVKIHKDDIGCLTQRDKRIRCKKFTVIKVLTKYSQDD